MCMWRAKCDLGCLPWSLSFIKAEFWKPRAHQFQLVGDPVSASPVLGWQAAATSALLWDECHRSKLWHSKLCGKHSTHRVIHNPVEKNITSSFESYSCFNILVVIDLFKLFKVSWFDFGKSYVCRNSSTLTRFSRFLEKDFSSAL